MYADYVFYVEAYGGENILPLDWPRISRHADAYLDRLTYNRMKNGAVVTDAVRMAACAVAEVMRRHEETQTANPAGIKAESVGGQSVTYEDAATLSERYEAELLEAVDLWLPGRTRCVMRGCMDADQHGLYPVSHGGRQGLPPRVLSRLPLGEYARPEYQQNRQYGGGQRAGVPAVVCCRSGWRQGLSGAWKLCVLPVGRSSHAGAGDARKRPDDHERIPI